jgi:choline dehydrogenase-like flavoprotein
VSASGSNDTNVFILDHHSRTPLHNTPTPQIVDWLVIGSGPAGTAATHALVKQGCRVVVLDAGKTLEPDRREVVERMSRQQPESWHREDINLVVGNRRTTKDTVHSKLSYGSSYTFGSSFPLLDIRWNGREGFNHSLAKGGLSNIWGSSLLSNRQADIEDWPVTVSELVPHYEAVMRFVPGTGIADNLEEILPTYSHQNNPLQPSHQGSSLLEDLEQNRDSLRKSGIIHGRSRLAIHANSASEGRHCTYCTLCLSGCPYGLIYSSSQTIDQLAEGENIDYRADHLVQSFESAGEEVIVRGIRPSTGNPFSIRAKRIFLGAGVLPTAMIVLRSIGAYDRPVRLVDSQYFIYPLLRFRVTHGVETERMHTAAQAFVEVDDRRVSRHLIHMQIYGYSTFLRDELMRTFLRWPLRSHLFRQHFLGRLLVAQGFIHSSESGSIELTLRKNSDGGVHLDACVHRSRKALATVLKLGWKLLKSAPGLRAIPLIPGLRVPEPGSGYHSGGSFPMREHPDDLETDVLGRLPTHPRVHIVDASVLPSVPATSITFSIMANAHRIATSAAGLDRS